MLDTSKWPQRDLEVLKGVRLDPKNVRLELADAEVEADIVEDLFANEDALGLVEAICQVGYLTHETPVVVKRDGEFVMVEGNRRLAALKAIQNPMLVPEYQARVSALTAVLADRSALAQIRVMVAPDQDAADQLVAAIHTSNLRKAWSPARQAAFFQAQIDAGRKLPDLLVRYPTIDVRKFVFRAHIINLFKSLPYADAEMADFVTTRRWSRGLSALARIYESADFLDLTGLSMDDAGVVTKSIDDDVLTEIGTVIVKGIADGDLNTRSLNKVTSPRFVELMAELSRIAELAPETDSGGSEPNAGTQAVGPPRPASASRGRPSATNGTNHRGATSSTAAAPPATTTSVQPKRSKQRFLDLSQIQPPDAYPVALKLLLGEISAINVQKFPNATFLMTRAALEKSIKSFAEAKGIDIKGTGNNIEGRVQLGQALKWLLDYVKANGPTYLQQVVEGVRTGKLNYATTKDSLDALNHNHHFKVDPDQAIAMWQSIDPVLRYLMKP